MFAFIALEWYRGYRGMQNRVTLVARDLERVEKVRLQKEIKQAIGMAGVGEVEALYKDDKALAEMAEHAFEIDQVDRYIAHGKKIASTASNPRVPLALTGGSQLPVATGNLPEVAKTNYMWRCPLTI